MNTTDMKSITQDELNTILDQHAAWCRAVTNRSQNDVDYIRVDFRNMDLSGLDFSNRVLVDARFENCRMQNVNMNNIDICCAIFVRCDLSRMRAQSGKFFKTEFIQCEMNECDMLKSNFIDAKFMYSNPTCSVFAGSEFVSTTFEFCDVSRSTFQKAMFQDIATDENLSYNVRHVVTRTINTFFTRKKFRDYDAAKNTFICTNLANTGLSDDI